MAVLHMEDGVPTDRPTDRPTDLPTNIITYKAAEVQLKLEGTHYRIHNQKGTKNHRQTHTETQGRGIQDFSTEGAPLRFLAILYVI